MIYVQWHAQWHVVYSTHLVRYCTRRNNGRTWQQLDGRVQELRAQNSVFEQGFLQQPGWGVGRELAKMRQVASGSKQ